MHFNYAHTNIRFTNIHLLKKLDKGKLEFDKWMFKLKVECYFKKNGCDEIMQLGELIVSEMILAFM